MGTNSVKETKTMNEKKKSVIHISNDVQPCQNIEHQRQPASAEKFSNVFSVYLIFFFFATYDVRNFILLDVYLWLCIFYATFFSFYFCVWFSYNHFFPLCLPYTIYFISLNSICGVVVFNYSQVHSTVNLWLCKQVFQQNNPISFGSKRHSYFEMISNKAVFNMI